MHEKNKFNQILGAKIENWTPGKPPDQSNLTGRYCHLELLNINKHAEKLFASFSFNNQGETWTYLPYGPFSTCGEFSEWLQRVLTEIDTQLYAIIDETSNLPIGISGFFRINPTHRTIEIGHLHFSKHLQKTPAATETIYLMLHHVFDNLQYRRCEWKCHSLNQASRNAALRYGFTFEGIFRQCNVFKNRNRDTAWFSIIDSEWPDIKIKFVNWLDPSNFDENGKQKKSLREIHASLLAGMTN